MLGVVQPAGSSPQTAQAEPSPKMGQSEPAFLMVEQSCGLDQPQVPATLTMCGGFDSLSQQRKGNAAPQPVVEEPPSAALQGLLDIDQILGVDVGQPESSLTLPTEEVIEAARGRRGRDLRS